MAGEVLRLVVDNESLLSCRGTPLWFEFEPNSLAYYECLCLTLLLITMVYT